MKLVARLQNRKLSEDIIRLFVKERTGVQKYISKLEILMKQAEITPQDREVAVVALNKEKELTTSRL